MPEMMQDPYFYGLALVVGVAAVGALWLLNRVVSTLDKGKPDDADAE